ncbi:N-acetylglucosamine-6-phosphate deacetylase [Granulicella aggregans]|uniref:N-acetylglucosamine-6-phosphate deacetylase n=1 Tax=Granulicella aggregans TaxID=474949 RepID=A0A7W8E4V6_9BACT|nr:N-acetylglucosamine-6-phosphate deacetylase [Granulicella aggregans]MBB5059463.1 N-acetylglucosamine-6-phosphate deacetylase [Granulicella aggregans]
MAKTITARALHTPDGVIDYPQIRIGEDGIVLSVEAGEANTDETVLTSSFLDVHIHGAVSHDVMETSASGFCEMERFLATRGVGHYLPTTVTAPIDEILRSMERIAEHIESADERGGEGRATPIGIHLEGPFLSHTKRGVHNAPDLLKPDIGLFDRFQDAARGHIRLMTVAPEVPGALELIAHATSRGVRLSMGHTNATAAEAHAGIAAGASSATHTFNAMRAMDHREPGVVSVVLTDEETFAELICDGIHVAPEMVKLFARCKSADKVILVTDGMSAAGMPDGTFRLGNFDVQVKDGHATARGVLAGSVITLDRAVANFAKFTGRSVATVARAASHNPAKMLGLEERFAVGVGRPANFNRFAPDGLLVETMLCGKSVTAREVVGRV